MPLSDAQFTQVVPDAATGQQTVFVRNITPVAFITGQCKEISIAGAGFLPPVKIVINGITIPASFTTPTLVKFVLPYIPAGTYDIVVVNGSNNHWISRQVLNITDPVGTHFDLGSAGKPMVLPPIIVEAPPTAKVNRASAYRKANAGATVLVDPATQDMTAYVPWDSSGVATEPVRVPTVQPNPSNGAILETPWGTFKND